MQGISKAVKRNHYLHDLICKVVYIVCLNYKTTNCHHVHIQYCLRIMYFRSQYAVIIYLTHCGFCIFTSLFCSSLFDIACIICSLMSCCTMTVWLTHGALCIYTSVFDDPESCFVLQRGFVYIALALTANHCFQYHIWMNIIFWKLVFIWYVKIKLLNEW